MEIVLLNGFKYILIKIYCVLLYKSRCTIEQSGHFNTICCNVLVCWFVHNRADCSLIYALQLVHLCLLLNLIAFFMFSSWFFQQYRTYLWKVKSISQCHQRSENISCKCLLNQVSHQVDIKRRRILSKSSKNQLHPE